MKMEKLNKAVVVIARIAEVWLWVGAALCAVMFVAGLLAPNWLRLLVDAGESASVEIAGQSLEVVDSQGNLISKATALLGLYGMLTLPLSAMVCRNIHLIFETAAGKTSFSKGKTPFQPDNVRMVREIGIFCIAIPVVQYLVTLVAKIAFGMDMTEAHVNDSSIFFGLVILCLSQFFAYGQSLQEEVDGIV